MNYQNDSEFYPSNMSQKAFGHSNSCHSCKPKPPVCKPAKINGNCSASMRDVLLTIWKTVNKMNLPGFGVHVEVTTTSGTMYEIPFTTGTQYPVQISETTITCDKVTISICDISKIKVLSGTIQDPSFLIMLQNALNKLTQVCTSAGCGCGCNCDCDCNYQSTCNPSFTTNQQCAQGIQDHIAKNQNKVEAIGYQGGNETIEAVSTITDVKTDFALTSVVANAPTVPVVGNVTLETTPIKVVTSITPLNTEVLTSENSTTESVVTSLTPVPATVSAPITTTPVDVITNIESTSAPNGIYTVINPQPESVVGSVTSTPVDVIGGFANSRTINGIISGVDTISRVATVPVEIPNVINSKIGALRITIPASSLIDAINNPTSEIVANVKVDGEDVLITGYSTIYVLAANTNLLGGLTSTPTVDTMTELSDPQPKQVIETVTIEPKEVVGTIDIETVPGEIITSYGEGSVNGVNTPTTIDVLQDVRGNTKDITVIGEDSSIAVNTLFRANTEDVAGKISLTVNPTSAVASVVLEPESEEFVTSFDRSTINVLAPNVEAIDGSITTVGDGIVAVHNKNGDLSIYSSCDINSVELE